MKRVLLLIVFTFLSFSVTADFTDCKSLYVGALLATDESFLVVLKQAQGDSSGSYAVSFNGWPEKEQAQAVSLLLAAKMSGHRVNVGTSGAEPCAITTGGKVFSYVSLANKP